MIKLLTNGLEFLVTFLMIITIIIGTFVGGNMEFGSIFGYAIGFVSSVIVSILVFGFIALLIDIRNELYLIRLKVIEIGQIKP